MDKERENAFFDIYASGGIASMCADALMVKYKFGDLGTEHLTDDWAEFYRKFPEKIKEKEHILEIDWDRLFAEIEKNLLELKNAPIILSSYCLSMLSPFANFLRKIRPTKHRKRELQQRADSARLLANSENKKDRELAERIKSDVEKDVADWRSIEQKFFEITQEHAHAENFEKYCEENHTEIVFSDILWNLDKYAVRLDWVFAQNGIDLLKLQRESGIYLMDYREIFHYIHLSGTKEIAQKVFNALPDNKGTNIPKELDTEDAKKLLQKIIQAEFCDTNYKWSSSMQLLAYLADKMSHYLNLTNKMDRDGTIQTCWKPFETLFEYEGKAEGKDKLKGAKQNWMKNNTKFEPTGHEKIDALFENLQT